MGFENWEKEGSECGTDDSSYLGTDWDNDDEIRDGGNSVLDEETVEECDGPQEEDRCWSWPPTKVRLTGRKKKRRFVVWGCKKKEEEIVDEPELCMGSGEGTEEMMVEYFGSNWDFE